METSDSEYFESADEDFYNDDEKQIDNKTKNIKRSEKNPDDKLLENTEKLSITGNSASKVKEKAEIVMTEEIHKTEKEITQEGASEIGNKIKNDVVDTNVRCKKPISRPECWEPGMNYENVSSTESVTQEQPTRPEFGIPAARVGGCCFGNSEFQRPRDRLPTAIPPSVSRSENISNKTSNKELKNVNENSEKEIKSKRPEFGIPPARTTCWVPGVTNRTNTESFEPHPAYLALMKTKEEMEEEKGGKQIQTQVQEDKSGENMWDNEDDWGDFDVNNKNDNPALDTLTSDNHKVQQSSKTSKQTSNEEISKPMINRKVGNVDNMWDNDEWEPVESNQEKLQQTKQSTSSWGSWGNWGLSTVLSTATNLTTQVSQGLSTVLETGIGAPDPEEMARFNKLQKEKLEETPPKEGISEEKPTLGFGLSNLMQGVTKLVETTSTKVIHGGLDTLETIGKKTMEVLQENDPGLKKKRAFLKLDDDKPILSQLLREAKEKAEQENKELEKKHFAKKANYETLFDDHQGLVHLEALEMLSKQCDIKLQNLLESKSCDNDMQETLDQVKELCELPEEEDEDSLSMNEIKEKLETAVTEINISITYKKLLSTWDEVEDWLSKVNLSICNRNELHQQAIESLAQLTALAVEQFHKAGELLLIKDHRSTVDEADSLVQLTITVTTLIGMVAAKFSEKLNTIAAESSEKEEINSLITNVFLEAANSSSYIQDAFQLLIPVLQVGAV